MNAIANESLKQLFLEARTFNHWLPNDVSDEQLNEIYELMKWGPTSANLCPARLVFIKSDVEKQKLISCLMPLNIEKVKAAPATVIIAQDKTFYEQIEKLYPQGTGFRELFESNASFAESTAFRNSSLQGAYFILAARALGFDCGPMSGFDNQKLDETFFSGSSWQSNFICNLGYGDRTKLYPRLPRLSFEEACQII